jgi:dihydrofolate synthase / folylpolyglutamate synthase
MRPPREPARRPPTMSPIPAAEDTLARLEPLGMRLGLEPFRRLLAALGDPHLGVPAVLVAGTNGKGSTAALLAAIGCAAGYRTGLYTSPHLEEPRERIRVDGLALPSLELDRLLDAVVQAAPEEPPTPFEALTAAAFLAFAEAGVELAVLEVGLGGRLDATNVVIPALSLVTEIALDHREHLGATVEAIAAEKAGILRPGVPALAWVTDPAAAAALARVAGEQGVELELLPEAWQVETVASGPGGQRVRLSGPTGSRQLALPFAGAHQLGNLALAVAAAEDLTVSGWPRLVDAIARGVAGCRWPGRLESVALPGGRRVVLDGAHNPHAAQALAAALGAEREPWALVFGALADKDVAAMAAVLAPRAAAIFLAPPENPRALPLAALAALPPLRRGAQAGDAGAALAAALAGPHPAVVVTGSLYLVGEARRWLRQRYGVPAAAAEVSAWDDLLALATVH